MDVYRRDRSQLNAITCGATDRRGRLTLDFRQPRNAALLIRVAQRENSAGDAFTLRVVAPDAPERPPGRTLGASGASGSVDRIANPDDACAASMRAGRSYRVHVVSRERCVSAALYPPGTASFPGGEPVRRFDCDDYFLFTPGPGERGRYSLQVVAPRSRRGALPYRLQVAPAGRDDTAPGIELANDERIRERCAAVAPTSSTSTGSTCGGRASSTCGCATGASNPFNLQLAFTPPTVGRWRVRATYDGTRQAAPRGPAGASLLVAEPLEE